MPSHPKVSKITCHKILNSRGNWTLATKVLLDDGSAGVQTIPDGASKGEHEAVSLDVTKSVQIVSSVLNDLLVGENAENQEKIDDLMISMDGTPNKSHLGGNSILSVSLAVARAVSQSKRYELFEYLAEIYENKNISHNQLKFPTPVFNILNGGKHAQNNLSFQEFMVIPSPKLDYLKSLDVGVEVYHLLKTKLISLGKGVNVGDEGGFAPEGYNPESALEIIRDAASKKYKPGEDVFFGMDVASGSFYDGSTYRINEINKSLNSSTLKSYYSSLLRKFEILYIEDPFYENDFKGWQDFYKPHHEHLMIVGDDLVVTNPRILAKVAPDNMINAVIVKPNQIGTLTETLSFIKTARKHNMKIIVSHRSGDTAEDTFISDLAVGVSSDFIKAGAPARGERVAKYNRLLDIYELCKSRNRSSQN